MLNRASTCPQLAPRAQVRASAENSLGVAEGVAVHPSFRCLPPPVIVVGMHRSGTSLVSGMLGALGLYMGPELQRLLQRGEAFWTDAAAAESGYGEADDFRVVNDRILDAVGAGWDRIDSLVADATSRIIEPECLGIAGRATHGCLRTSYLMGAGRSYSGRWGWKDPRSSLTLAAWLTLFPEALVLHVRRDRTAAVNSLHRRAVAWSRRTPPVPTFGQRAAWALTHPIAASACVARRLGLLARPVGAPDPCLDWDYCAQLYDGYVGTCRRYASVGRQYVEVQYEDLVAGPQATVRRLVGLLDLHPTETQVTSAAGMVRRPTVRTEAEPAARR